MAKSIRLLNVDYIVTSSDKIVDLNEIGVAPATGYYGGESVMFGGGNDGSNVISCELKQFATNATGVAHGDLSECEPSILDESEPFNFGSFTQPIIANE